MPQVFFKQKSKSGDKARTVDRRPLHKGSLDLDMIVIPAAWAANTLRQHVAGDEPEFLLKGGTKRTRGCESLTDVGQ